MKRQLLKSIRIQNFKAVRDTGKITLPPLTVFIGNNGSGKSSVIEALQTLEAIVQDGLEKAIAPWHGFENVWNKAVAHPVFAPKKHRTPVEGKQRPHCIQPLSLRISGTVAGKYAGGVAARMDVTADPGGNRIFILAEDVRLYRGPRIRRDAKGFIQYTPSPEQQRRQIRLEDGESVMKDFGVCGLGHWQFLTLVPQQMTDPVPQKRVSGEVRLASTGANVAQYMSWIRDADQSAFAGILEALQYVLPYARDVQIQLTSEVERAEFLQMTEADFKIPGWMFSTGTLRVLALLALLRSPAPPPLIVVEEIENGLDPRSVNLILQEIRGAVESGRTQVIVTTHSPYLLDLLDLSHLVLCERVEGQPVFVRPQDRKGLRDWAKSFAPGQLYVMDRMHAEGR